MKSINVRVSDDLFTVLSALATYWKVDLDFIVERLLAEAARVSLEVTKGMGAYEEKESKIN